MPFDALSRVTGFERFRDKGFEALGGSGLPGLAEAQKQAEIAKSSTPKPGPQPNVAAPTKPAPAKPAPQNPPAKPAEPAKPKPRRRPRVSQLPGQREALGTAGGGDHGPAVLAQEAAHQVPDRRVVVDDQDRLAGAQRRGRLLDQGQRRAILGIRGHDRHADHGASVRRLGLWRG